MSGPCQAWAPVRLMRATAALAGVYKGTVNLPDTKFNMRANSVQREPELQVELPPPSIAQTRRMERHNNEWP